ncbi:MAG: N,N-dimethylformamidase beta subunit family domain-containing protein [Terriglobia bacterium]
MLIGFVSDEHYAAIPDALIEFQAAHLKEPVVVRSTPRGEVFAALDPGTYTVTLSKEGFGSKSVLAEIGETTPRQFRLLRDGLLGYMWPQWLKAGFSSEFRVHSVEEYQLSLWHYGWKKEFVRMIGWYDEHGPRATMQITPDGDYTQTGVQWNQKGYGSRHHAQMLTAPERSGLYYLHAKTLSGRFFSFPWIVAPAKPTAPIAVLASTITWNAYNNFGGRSNYINPDGLPESPVVNARLELRRYCDPESYSVWKPTDSRYLPLSFDRPDVSCHVPESTEVTSPIAGRLNCVSAPGEWRLLGWLEREGFAYDLYADAQLHFGELPLEKYRVLMLSVHPEYWTREMYLRVKRWVFESGGRLMYLGGNGLNCEVTLSNDRILRCLTHLRALEGGRVGDCDRPGQIFESRMHRTFEPESRLLGVAYTDRGIMTAAPYRAIDNSHWAFAGTHLQNGDLFGTRTLHERVPHGASGHETDKRSASSPPGVRLLAKGTNPEEGGAEMVWFEVPSGGQVFSVGSITYIASLLVDEYTSRVTANVLSCFLG